MIKEARLIRIIPDNPDIPVIPDRARIARISELSGTDMQQTIRDFSRHCENDCVYTYPGAIRYPGDSLRPSGYVKTLKK